MLTAELAPVAWALVAIPTSVVLIVALALCLCKQGADKSLNFLGENNQVLSKSSPVAYKVQSTEDHQNGDLRTDSPLEKVSLHPRPVTERALPTPPGRPQSLPTVLPNPAVAWDNSGSSSSNNNNGIAAAAPDGHTTTATLVRPHRRNKAHAPPPPMTTPLTSATPHVVATVSNGKEAGAAGGDTPSESSESDPLYSVANVRAPSALDDGAPPPVPEKRFDIIDTVDESAQPPVLEEAPAPFRQANSLVPPGPGTSAHTAEISFPVPTMTELPGSSTQAAGKSDLSYTVISVREPLAKVREETMRQKPAQTATATQEAYYTEVPEEEQMYAEIESGHNSAGSSVTYARIEPRTAESHPPAPPTVESLKSVAQAHSRQASVTSASSLGAPSPDVDIGNLYTAVDKCSKQRQTIHISEGLASATEVPTNLDELYAKVHKPHRQPVAVAAAAAAAAAQDEGADGKKPPPPPPPAAPLHEAFLVHDRPRSMPPNIESVVSCTNVTLVREYEEKKELVEALPPPPEEYADPAYERVYHQDSSDTDPCYERVASGHGSDGVSDPGYEKVAKRFDREPDYETLRKDAATEYSEGGSDPHYEQIRKSDKASAAHEDDDKATGAACGLTQQDSGSTADYGYERIKGRRSQPEDEGSDPGYEQICRRGEDDTSDPGYERIHRSHSDACSQADSDPGYERIRDRSGAAGRAWHNRGKSSGDFGYRKTAGARLAAAAAAAAVGTVKQDNNGSSDETYESVRDDVVRKLGYSLMKGTGSSTESPTPSPVWKQVSDSSSASDRGAEDSSSEEPGYERVRHRDDDADDMSVGRPSSSTGRCLGVQARIWRCSDSNLTSGVETAERATSTYSLNANLDDGGSEPVNNTSGEAVLYEVVRGSSTDVAAALELVTDNEPVPITWARHSTGRSSEHKEREYIF
ncbi:uncharacterized protein LOC144098335 isoform X2 [Amblyomma americanum]